MKFCDFPTSCVAALIFLVFVICTVECKITRTDGDYNSQAFSAEGEDVPNIVDQSLQSDFLSRKNLPPLFKVLQTLQGNSNTRRKRVGFGGFGNLDFVATSLSRSRNRSRQRPRGPMSVGGMNFNEMRRMLAKAGK